MKNSCKILQSSSALPISSYFLPIFASIPGTFTSTTSSFPKYHLILSMHTISFYTVVEFHENTSLLILHIINFNDLLHLTESFLSNIYTYIYRKPLETISYFQSKGLEYLLDFQDFKRNHCRIK